MSTSNLVNEGYQSDTCSNYLLTYVWINYSVKLNIQHIPAVLVRISWKVGYGKRTRPKRTCAFEASGASRLSHVTSLPRLAICS